MIGAYPRRYFGQCAGFLAARFRLPSCAPDREANQLQRGSRRRGLTPSGEKERPSRRAYAATSAGLEPEKIVPNGPVAEWSAVMGMETTNRTAARERLVPPIFELNVTSTVLAVISDQHAKKSTTRSRFAVETTNCPQVRG